MRAIPAARLKGRRRVADESGVNIVPGEPLPPRPVFEEDHPPAVDESVPTEPPVHKTKRRARLSFGRVFSVLLIVALASGPAAVQAFREGTGAPSDLLACEATVTALSGEGSALAMMLDRWAEADDGAISGQVEPARAAMTREDVDGFVEIINRVVERCHDVSGDFTDRFDAFCHASAGNCQDRVRLF